MAERMVSDVMLTTPKTLPADLSVADARRALESSSVEILLLVDGDRFRGAVTAIPDDAAPEEPALRYRDDSPPSTTESAPVSEALALLEDRSHGRIVVLDGDRLAGLVCLTADGERFCGTPGAMSEPPTPEVDERAQLRTITHADRPVVERLWQLYSHDMSEVRGTLPNAEGVFKPGRLPTYLDDPETHGYLISFAAAPVGFAFVHLLPDQTHTIGDFFVVRAARRKRVGFDVARELLARHPGHWEIGFQAENDGAPEFWRRVATDAVGDRWREELRPVPGKPRIPHDHFIVFDT